MKFTWENIKSKLLNKYSFAFIAFLVIIVFIDENNFIGRAKSRQRIAELNDEIEYYQNKIVEDEKQIEELNESLENLETFARENYLMHRHNEEIFIIEE